MFQWKIPKNSWGRWWYTCSIFFGGGGNFLKEPQNIILHCLGGGFLVTTKNPPLNYKILQAFTLNLEGSTRKNNIIIHCSSALQSWYLFGRQHGRIHPGKLRFWTPKNGGVENEFPFMFDVQNDNFQGVYVSSLEITFFQQHLGEPKLLHLWGPQKLTLVQLKTLFLRGGKWQCKIKVEMDLHLSVKEHVMQISNIINIYICDTHPSKHTYTYLNLTLTTANIQGHAFFLVVLKKESASSGASRISQELQGYPMVKHSLRPLTFPPHPQDRFPFSHVHLLLVGGFNPSQKY